MQRQKQILKCDHCDKEVNDGREVYFGGHPFQGWFQVRQRGGSTRLKELERKRDWDFCSKECLCAFFSDNDQANRPAMVTTALDSRKYDNRRIAKELRLTASGQSYYGNALYVAMDMPEIVAAPEQRHAILRYLNGTQICTDHIWLQEAAMLISRDAKMNHE